MVGNVCGGADLGLRRLLRGRFRGHAAGGNACADESPDSGGQRLEEHVSGCRRRRLGADSDYGGTGPWTSVAVLAGGLLVGSLVGPLLARRLPAGILRWAAAILGFVLAVILFVDTL